MIAALFVDEDGAYARHPNIDAWGISRDARRYEGPHRVIAHPPCQRWGRYATGGPSASWKRTKGDDGGCFATALHAVRIFGGVLEHPAHSAAFQWFGIRVRPDARGGWVPADDFGGHMCHVEQGHYGHRARKATWLYAVPSAYQLLPELTWGASISRCRLDDGFHSSAERAAAVASGWAPSGTRLTARENLLTPEPFRDVLIGISTPTIPT